MPEYSKLKNAELEALLKQRSLPHSGKKADMIARLQEDDKKKATVVENATPAAEDEIDWDDDAADAPKAASELAPAITVPSTAEPTTQAAATAIAAGGKGPVANPQAVPNQVADIDPSKTDDLTIKELPAPVTASDIAPASATLEKANEPKPVVSFSAGLPETTLEEEIQKRKMRAAKFGLVETEDETLKKMERAKKFGQTEVPVKVNEALPERRKRAREGGDDENSKGSYKKHGRGGNGRGGKNHRNGGRQNHTSKEQAEARKRRFA